MVWLRSISFSQKYWEFFIIPIDFHSNLFQRGGYTGPPTRYPPIQSQHFLVLGWILTIPGWCTPWQQIRAVRWRRFAAARGFFEYPWNGTSSTQESWISWDIMNNPAWHDDKIYQISTHQLLNISGKSFFLHRFKDWWRSILFINHFWLVVTGCHLDYFPRNIGFRSNHPDEVHHFSGWGGYLNNHQPAIFVGKIPSISQRFFNLFNRSEVAGGTGQSFQVVRCDSRMIHMDLVPCDQTGGAKCSGSWTSLNY